MKGEGGVGGWLGERVGVGGWVGDSGWVIDGWVRIERW